mmetsp:Transcript_13464/g.33681  ORF Transcript_13464/g.33681 Transcript_13464/m.33681 type:complete len:217 (-) Transcript_13464:328-978(-)
MGSSHSSTSSKPLSDMILATLARLLCPSSRRPPSQLSRGVSSSCQSNVSATTHTPPTATRPRADPMRPRTLFGDTTRLSTLFTTTTSKAPSSGLKPQGSITRNEHRDRVDLSALSAMACLSTSSPSRRSVKLSSPVSAMRCAVEMQDASPSTPMTEPNAPMLASANVAPPTVQPTSSAREVPVQTRAAAAVACSARMRGKDPPDPNSALAACPHVP